MRASKALQYRIVCSLANGSYGSCYKVQHKGTGQVFVMKVVSLKGVSASECFAEARLLQSVKHPNVVEYQDAWEESDMLYIIMQYCADGDLAAFLKQRRYLPEAEAWHLANSIASGLQCLHAHDILHRDVKPSNMFMAEGKAMVGDLGLGRHLVPGTLAQSQVGTPLYFSPELCREQPYGKKSDVWALGCVVYEMVVGFPPFVAANQVALADKICRQATPRLPAGHSAALQQLVDRMLQKDPERRPTMLECLQAIRKHCSAPVTPPPRRCMPKTAADMDAKVAQQEARIQQLTEQLRLAHRRQANLTSYYEQHIADIQDGHEKQLQCTGPRQRGEQCKQLAADYAGLQTRCKLLEDANTHLKRQHNQLRLQLHHFQAFAELRKGETLAPGARSNACSDGSASSEPGTGRHTPESGASKYRTAPRTQSSPGSRLRAHSPKQLARCLTSKVTGVAGTPAADHVRQPGAGARVQSQANTPVGGNTPRTEGVDRLCACDSTKRTGSPGTPVASAHGDAVVTSFAAWASPIERGKRGRGSARSDSGHHGKQLRISPEQGSQSRPVVATASGQQVPGFADVLSSWHGFTINKIASSAALPAEEKQDSTTQTATGCAAARADSSVHGIDLATGGAVLAAAGLGAGGKHHLSHSTGAASRIRCKSNLVELPDVQPAPQAAAQRISAAATGPMSFQPSQSRLPRCVPRALPHWLTAFPWKTTAIARQTAAVRQTACVGNDARGAELIGATGMLDIGALDAAIARMRPSAGGLKECTAGGRIAAGFDRFNQRGVIEPQDNGKSAANVLSLPLAKPGIWSAPVTPLQLQRPGAIAALAAGTTRLSNGTPEPESGSIGNALHGRSRALAFNFTPSPKRPALAPLNAGGAPAGSPAPLAKQHVLPASTFKAGAAAATPKDCSGCPALRQNVAGGGVSPGFTQIRQAAPAQLRRVLKFDRNKGVLGLSAESFSGSGECREEGSNDGRTLAKLEACKAGCEGPGVSFAHGLHLDMDQLKLDAIVSVGSMATASMHQD